MAELTRRAATVTLERAGARLVEHAPPASPDVRDYPNERAALAIFRKRLVELLTGGWLITRDDEDLRPVASWPAMEARLRERFDPDQISVYNDFLIDRGDPCGAAAAQRVTSPTVETFGCFASLAETVRSIPLSLVPQWEHGWMSGVHVRNPRSARALALLLGAPIARFLSRLEIDGHDVRELASMLRGSPYRARIRELTALETYAANTLPEVFPALERATLGSASGHKTIRELVLQVRPYAASLIAGDYPALEHLTLRVGAPADDELVELVEETPFEKLRSLRRVDLDGEISARTLDRIRDRLAAFTG